MKRVLRRLLIAASRISGSALIQRALELNIRVSQYLQGIGSGSDAESSGESVLVSRLRQRHTFSDRPLCVFDVGSNKGQFLTLILRGLHGIPVHIHAFEPSRHAYNVLCANVEGYPNVTLNNTGLGKQVGEFELFYDREGSELASLYERKLDHMGVRLSLSEKVRIDTVDDYCRKNHVDAIDLLKLDVEGNELAVLEGAMEMLKRAGIEMVSFEFGGCNIDSRTYFRDFYHYFKANGMHKMFRLTPGGGLIPIHQYREIYEQFRTTNFLVLRR